MAETSIKNHAAFIWSVADLLRGDYRQSEYGKVILPLTVVRRLDCVLEPTKPAVLKRAKALKGQVENVDPVLENVAGQKFFNTSSSTSAVSSMTPGRSPEIYGAATKRSDQPPFSAPIAAANSMTKMTGSRRYECLSGPTAAPAAS